MHSKVPSDTEDRGGLEELEERDCLGICDVGSKTDGAWERRGGEGKGRGEGKKGRGEERGREGRRGEGGREGQRRGEGEERGRREGKEGEGRGRCRGREWQENAEMGVKHVKEERSR